MLRLKPVVIQRRVAAVIAPLAFILCMGVSHQALALCPSTAPTINDDTITCDDASGDLDLLSGDDKFTATTGADLNGDITGNVDDDLLIIKDGTNSAPGSITGGNGAASGNDTDRIFVFGGDFNDFEVQTGAGEEAFIVFMDGTITDGSLEIRRGSEDATIVFDGGTLFGEIELQSGNGTINDAPRDPTIYFRSGLIEAEDLDLDAVDNDGVGRTDVTLIFDPVNSKDIAQFITLADGAANGADPTISTMNLNLALEDGDENTDPDHKMIMNVEEVVLGAGDDEVSFVGAVNMGDDAHNLELNGEDGEATAFNAGKGEDTLEVEDDSELKLGELVGFEFLEVEESTLVLEESEYTFGTTVGGTFDPTGPGGMTEKLCRALVYQLGRTPDAAHRRSRAYRPRRTTQSQQSIRSLRSGRHSHVRPLS